MSDLAIKNTELANKSLRGKNKGPQKPIAQQEAFPAEVEGESVKQAVGRTLWDILSTTLPVFKKYPKILLMVLLILVGGLMVTAWKTNLKFTYINGVIGIESSPTPGNDISTESISGSSRVEIDKLKKKAAETNRPYIILSISDRSQIEFECIKNQPKLVNRRRVTYVILALRKIKKEENLFVEQYYSSETTAVERNPGTENEIEQTGGPWSVEIEMEAGETRTITTGAVFYYDLPLKSRLALGQQLSLNFDDQFFSYPNKEDVVGEIVMQIESKSFDLSVMGGKAARRFNKDTSNLLPGDVIRQQTVGTTKTVSLSSRWLNIMPNQEVGIAFKLENLAALIATKQKTPKK